MEKKLDDKKTIKFIEKSKKIHGNKYDYSLVVYINQKTKIKIICPIHGEFEQTPKQHIAGYGCKKCGILKPNDEFILDLKKIYGDKYDYSKVNYGGNNEKVIIICPIHGEFKQTPHSLLRNINCQKCSGKYKMTTDEYIKEAKKIHKNKYDYSLVNYKGTKHKIKIICLIHGEFEQRADLHLKGHECPKCKDNTKNINIFVQQSNLLHKNKFNYNDSDYINAKTKLKIVCPIHGKFEQTPNDHLDGHGCPKCGLGYNILEDEIKDFIKSLNVNIIENSKSIIPPQELDIFIPSHNLAIEFDGLYWHSELYKDKKYHLNKTIECKAKRIQLIHIFEDEWLFKKDIIKSRLKNILGLTTNKIYARKCIIKEITVKEAKDFMNPNHLQGYTNSLVKLGLFYNKELVSVMLFNKPRKGIGGSFDGYELSRFANKTDYNVIGGASKLLKYFINNYQPKEIRSYADRRWSDGGLYETLGFELTHINKPNYWYIENKKRLHRFNFRKKILKKQGFNTDNNTEHEIMLERGINRIYDCGTLSYKKTITN